MCCRKLTSQRTRNSITEDSCIKKITKKLAISLPLLLVGCGENPLLGEWVHADVKPVGCRVVKFTSNREYCDSMSYEVTYEVQGPSVLVKPDQKSALLPVDMTYTIISENVISYISPLHQKEVFFYRKGSPAITAEAIEYSRKFRLDQLRKSCDSGPVKVSHESQYWSETMPKKIHEDMCMAALIKSKS